MTSHSEPTFAPERIVAALNEHGVAYVIVGGLAASAHGVVRATRDLDLVPDPAPANMARLAHCLTNLGGEHPVEGELTALSLARPVSFKVSTQHGDVQVLNRMAGVPPFVELRRNRTLVGIEPETFAPVCSLAHLRAMKRTANRPRDLVDLAELAELHGAE